MKFNPKIILGLIIFTLLIFAVAKLSKQDSSSSRATLNSQENKFRINFEISKNDQEKFSHILQKLNLRQDAQKEFFFELDGTSSAKLTFASPVKSGLEISEDAIIFDGESTHPIEVNEFQAQNFKIPKSSYLAVAAASFKDFIGKKAATSNEFSDWIKPYLISSKGQYLIIFGENADFALIFKSESPDFDALKNLRIREEPIYFSESNQNTEFHIIKIPESEESKSQTFTIFQFEDWTFVTSSYESAQEMLSTQKGEKESIEFPDLNMEQIALAVLYNNQNEIQPGDNFYDLLFDAGAQFKDTLKKIKLFKFTLKSNRFSGLISVR